MVIWGGSTPASAKDFVETDRIWTITLVQMVEDLSLRSVEARLARLLLEQAHGETVLRRQWATQREMASHLGTVTDVVNRTLRKMVDLGMIKVERHQIQILDPQGLKDLSQMLE